MASNWRDRAKASLEKKEVLPAIENKADSSWKAKAQKALDNKGYVPEAPKKEVDWLSVSGDLKKELASALSGGNFDKDASRGLVENYAGVQFKLFDENLKKGYTSIKPVGENLSNLFKAHGYDFDELYPDLAENFATGNIEAYAYGASEDFKQKYDERLYHDATKDALLEKAVATNEKREHERNAEEIREENKDKAEAYNAERERLDAEVDWGSLNPQERLAAENKNKVLAMQKTGYYENPVGFGATPEEAAERKAAAEAARKGIYADEALFATRTMFDVMSRPDFEEKSVAISEESERKRTGSFAIDLYNKQEYDTKPVGFTDDMWKTYIYLRNTEGFDAAERFKNGIENTTNSLAAENISKVLQTGEDKGGISRVISGVMQGGYAFASGVEGLGQAAKGVADTFTGDTEYFMPGTSQMITAKNKEDVSLVGKLALGVAEGAPQVLGTAALGAINPIAGTVFLGGTAYGSSYVDAINSGATRAGAIGMGVANAALEIALERYVGNTIEGFGTSLSGKVGKGLSKTKIGQKFLTGFDDFAKVHPKRAVALATAGRMFGNSSSEFVEEYLAETASPFLRNLFLGENNDITLISPEQVEAGLIGFITGGVLEGVRGGITLSNLGTDYGVRVETIKLMSDAKALSEYKAKFGSDAESADKARAFLLDSERFVASVAAIGEYAKEGLSYEEAVNKAEKDGIDISGFEEFTKAAYGIGRAETVNAYAQNNENKNKGEKLDDSSIVLEKNEASYPYDEKSVIDGYEKAVDNRILDFINKVRSIKDDSRKKKQYIIFSKVDEDSRLSKDIQRLTGVNVNGFNNRLNGNDFLHIEADHGQNGRADRSMSNDSDLARISFIIDNYDAIELVMDKDGFADTDYEHQNFDQTPSKMIKLSKKINGTYYVVESVPDSKSKSIYVKSVYISKDGSKPRPLNMSKDPQLTPETLYSQNATTNGSISHSTEDVNSIASRLIGEGEATSYIADRITSLDKSISRDEATRGINEAKQRAFAKSLENTTMSDFEKANAIQKYVLKEQALDRMYNLGATGLKFDSSMGAGLLSEADAYKAFTRGENAAKATKEKLDKENEKIFEEAPAAPAMEADRDNLKDDTLDDSSIVLEKDLDEYSVAKQKVIEEYENYSNPKISEFVNDVLAGKNAEKGILLNNVSDKAADIIGNLTGVDVHGFKTGLEDRIVRHINERHGKNGSADQSMSNPSDLERIQYVIDNFDSIEHSGRSNSYTTIKKNGFPALAQTVTYSKAINGTFYVVEAVPDTKAKTLQIVSAFIETKKKGDDSSHNAEIDQAETSETYSAVQPSGDSISHSSKDVNTVISSMGSLGRALYNKVIGDVTSKAATAGEVNAAREGFAHVYEAGARGVPYKRSKAGSLHIKEINAIYDAAKKDAAARANVKKKTDAKVEKDEFFYKAKVSKRTERILEGVAKVVGRDIRFSDKLKGNAKIDLEKGEIIISTKAKEGHTWAMIHEVYHALVVDSPAEAAVLKKTVLDIAGKNKAAFKRLLDRYGAVYASELYDKDGNLRADAAEYVSDEMVADLVGYTLSDPAILEKLTGQQRTVLQKFVDRLVSMFGDKNTRAASEYLSKAEGDMRAIFKDVAREADSIAEQFKAALDTSQKAEKNTVAKDGVRNSLEIISGTNKKYVKADRKVIFGNNPSVWARSVESYINEKIRNHRDVQLLAEDGDILTLTSDTAGKAKYRNSVRRGNGVVDTMNDNEYLVKLITESHIDEIAKASKQIPKNAMPAIDTKNHPFAKDGFLYRTAYFMDFDGKYYRLTISVGLNNGVKTVYNIGKIKETTFPQGSSKAQSTKGAAGTNVVSTNNYTQKNGNVNTSDERNSKEIFTDEIHSDDEVAIDKAALLAEIKAENMRRWGAELGRSEDSGKVLSINEAIKKVQDSFGIKVVSGGDASVTGKNISSYNESTRTIRTKFKNDLPAVCHALGYHIDKTLGVVDRVIEQTAKVREGVSGYGIGAWESELLKLVNYNGKDSRKAIKEGFSEFIRMYLVAKNLAKEAAPVFYSGFESILKEDAELQRAVEASAEAVHGYFAQSAGERASAAVMTAEDWKKLNKPRGKEAIRSLRDWVTVRLFDRFYGIKSAEKEQNVFDLTTSKNAYVKATLSLTARAKAARLLDDGFFDANGNKVGESFFDIIKPLGAEYSDKFKAFGDYLSFVHALEWIEPNKVKGKKTSSGKDIYNAKAKGKVFADETLNDATELRSLISDMESKHPEFKAIAKKIYEYQDNLMNYYLVPSGALSQDQAEVFKAQYPHYVPFNRFNTVFGEATRSGRGASRYFGNLKNPIQKADGGNAPIRHPLESIINSTFSAVDFYMKNDTMLSMIEEFTGSGSLPGVMERIYSTEELKKLDEKGQNPFVVEKAFDGRKNSEYQENCKTLISMNSVADLKGDELDGDKSINIKIKELFEKWDNEINTERFGKVQLTASSVRSELRHGITRNKITSFAAIPQVLEKGVVIDNSKKNNGEVERIVVAAPITISGTPYFMGVMIQKDINTNRLYLHDVVIKKETSEYQTQHLSTTGAVENQSLHMTEILERAISVGNSIPQSFENVNMGVKKKSTSVRTSNAFISAVKDVLLDSDEEAKAKAEEGKSIKIFAHTPRVILENVEGSRDLPIAMNYTKIYLSAKENGVIDGNYHGLGKNLITFLPKILKDPDVILEMDNGRLNLISTVEMGEKNFFVVSLELDTHKEVDNQYMDCNVVVSSFDAGDKYLFKNLIPKHAVSVKYEKEGLPQVNPQLHDSLAIINGKPSSKKSIPQSFENVNIGVNESTESAYNPVIDKEKGIVYAWVNGEKRFYQIYDRGLYNAVANLEVQNLRGFFKVFNSITNVLKVTMTMRNPLFGPGNFYRDFMTFHYNTTSNANIFMQLSMYAGAIGSIVNKDESYQLYKALGGGDMGKFTADMDAIKKTVSRRNSEAIKWSQMSARDFGQKVIKNIGGLKFLWDKYFELNDILETLPRLSEFKYTMKETHGDVNLAMYRSQDVTTNFSRSGSWGRNLNSIFLFSNAELQGIDKMVRNYTEAEYLGKNKKGEPDKSRIAGKILKTVGWSLFMTALSQFINRRDEEAEEEYARLSEFIKNNYDVFYIRNGYFAKLPKEQNLAIPRTVMQRIFDAACGDGLDLAELGSYIWEGITPGFVPDIFDIKNVPHQIANNTPISVFTDVMANRDFKGAEIVPSYLDGPEYLKYNNYTSAISVNIAKNLYKSTGFDISPMAIDHYIGAFGYYGTLFTDLFPHADVSEKGFWGSIRENRFNALGVGNKFTVDARYSTDLLNDFYEGRDRAEARLGIDSGGENRLVNEKYKVLGSFISNYNKQSRVGSEEQQRLDRKMLQVILEGFDEGEFSEGEKYAIHLYDVTGNEAVFVSSFPSATLRSTKTTKGKKTVTEAILDANAYAEYCSEISKMREAVRVLVKNLGLDEGTAAEFLAKEYSDINADIKEKYLSLYGKTQDTVAEKTQTRFDEKEYEKAYNEKLDELIGG